MEAADSEKNYVPSADFMREAISLAKKGGGKVHPNPMVGCVIEKNGSVVARGFHRQFGGLHAEREALKNAAENSVDLRGAVLYVTLEPCCHSGKQPPCTDAIIASGIKTVVIGSRDPNPLVDGKGCRTLEQNGIHVIRDFLKDECDSLNEIFFHFITKKNPFVILKFAVSADGKTSLSTGESRWISGEKSREFVHFLRGNVAAVMCGMGTVQSDDPLLTCRIQGEGLKQPLRVVLDKNLEISGECNLVKTAAEFPLAIFTSENCDSARKKELEAKNVKIFCVKSVSGHLDLQEVLKILGENSVDSVLVESGGRLNSAFLFFDDGTEKKCLADKILCFVSPKIFGGKNGAVNSAVQGEECESIEKCVKLSVPRVKFFDGDVLLEYNVEAR
jgi:diaminohydroxyphosphoribosylaminopyrimidine deaminase/5-amino-6-(5-phosphoribosylamino)uracil reductase